MAGKYKAVVFDIDGTLTTQISWTAFTRDIGGDVARHLAIYHDHINGHIGLDESKRLLLEMWQQTGKANKAHIEDIFENWPIRPEAQSVVSALKEKGYVICLITGSLGIYAKYIADKLGVEQYYANAELYFDNKGGLIDFHYTADQAEVKLAHLHEFCAKNQLQLHECVPVGDSYNDVEIFRQTGNGILVTDSSEVTDQLRSVTNHSILSLNDLLMIL